MAVRFDNSGEYYSRTINWGTQSAFTVCCWVKAEAPVSLLGVWRIEQDDQDNDYVQLSGAFGGGALLVATDEATGPIGSLTISTDTWYFVGVSINGSSGRRVSKAAGGSFSTATWGSGTGPVNMVELFIGTSRMGGWIGSIAGLKIWTAALTQAQLEAEATQFAPVRSGNLRAYYRFAGPSTTDDSGQGQTLSGGVGATADTDPAMMTTIALTDTGTASDTLSATAAVTLTQPASAADALTSGRLVVLTDTGAAAQTLNVAATVKLAETGTAADSVFNGQPTLLNDTAAGADTLKVDGAAAGVAETAAAAEALGVAAAVPLGETGTAADTLTVSEVLFPVVGESASAVDSLTVVEVKDRHAVALPLHRTWSASAPTI
ncbi:hypothetical protein [Streptosporangium longisporum]|uniref:LamG-like jellyroll fold domain-containing protein n=1 Tax=Streptosporangium longisporum TaxID=46187 RepID=A0ABP6L2X6_9ACTN